VIQFETLPKWLLRISIPLIFMALMVGSALAGGRSTVLLTAAFVAAFYSIRIEADGSSIRPSAGNWLLLGLVAIAAFVYILYVFAAHAASGNMGPSYYARTFMEDLGAQPDS